MSYVQRPCTCGGTNFLVLPNIQLHYGTSTHSSLPLLVTCVVCQQCTRTEMFTNNADQVAKHVTASMIAAGPQ